MEDSRVEGAAGVPHSHQALEGGAISRHRHALAYCAIVLDGSYRETGDHGRITLRAGDVAVHAAFEAHANFVGRTGASVVNLSGTVPLLPGFYRPAGLDEVLRFAGEGRIQAALGALAREADRLEAEGDWPDLLARDLRADPRLRLDRWALDCGLREGQLSSGFRKAFGISPKRFRAELKATRAATLIRATAEPLAQIAEDAGFADQAHMTHAVRALTGATPAAIRRARAGAAHRGS